MAKEDLKAVFRKGIHDKHMEFRQGFSEYLLSTYYVKKKKEAGKLSEEMQAKFKTVFDVINEKQADEFIDDNELWL